MCWILVKIPCHFGHFLFHVNKTETWGNHFHYKHHLPVLHQTFFHTKNIFAYKLSTCLKAQQERLLLARKFQDSCFFVWMLFSQTKDLEFVKFSLHSHCHSFPANRKHLKEFLLNRERSKIVSFTVLSELMLHIFFYPASLNVWVGIWSILTCCRRAEMLCRVLMMCIKRIYCYMQNRILPGSKCMFLDYLQCLNWLNKQSL